MNSHQVSPYETMASLTPSIELDGECYSCASTHSAEDPLLWLMREMSFVASGEVRSPKDNSLFCTYSNVKWLEDKVAYVKTYPTTYPKRGRPALGFSVTEFIDYPRTRLTECFLCGAPHAIGMMSCRRCQPIVRKTIADAKREKEEQEKLQKDFYELGKTIKDFEGAIRERYKRHSGKTADPVVKVRRRAVGRS